ncbi:MAG: cell division protein FtsA [Rickettsia sp.]|nr:cell division protein FtsA [Rickettsia sp.]
MYKNDKGTIVFDIGDSKIAVICANIISETEIDLVHCNVYSPEGFNGGCVTNMERASHNLSYIIYNLEKDYKKTVKEVTLVISPQLVKSYYVSVKKSIDNKIIDQNILDKIYEEALSKISCSDKDVLHYFPIEFLLDESYVVENPLGLIAQKIECKIHFITSNKILLRNIVNCFARVNVEIKEFILSSYVLGKNMKLKYQKSNSLILDIGCKYSSFTIFHGESPVYTSYVMLGGENITKKIASKFLLSMNSAEKIKILYGNAILDNLPKDDIIKIDREDFDLHRQDIILNSLELSEIINSELDHILQQLSSLYYKLGIEEQLNVDTVSLCGGCSNINRTRQLAIEYFSKPVRVMNFLLDIPISNNLDHASTIHVTNMVKFIASGTRFKYGGKIKLKNFWKWLTY